MLKNVEKLIKSVSSNTLYDCILCENIGTTILGIKSCEIINIPRCMYKKLKDIDENIMIKVVKVLPNNKLKVLVINKSKLDYILKEKDANEVLVNLGYPKEYDLFVYINHLMNKLSFDNDFPHEIGIFLGYSLKDVLGYMGLLDIPYQKTLGWYIYGDVEESEILYNEICTTKKQVRAMFEKIHNKNVI